MTVPRTTMDASATSMEAAAPADTAAAATTASQRLIGNQGCTNQHNGCQNNESITKHGMILLMIGVPRILAARFDPELGAALAFITIAGRIPDTIFWRSLIAGLT